MKIKGIHLDLKAQTMKFEFLKTVILQIADMGFNTILIEYQDKFPYSGNFKKLAAPDALTKENIEELKVLCMEKSIELIPMLQSIGHMYWVTRFPEYAFLGEHYDEKGRGSHSMCCRKKESAELFFKLSKQIMDMHSESKYFHIGGDEVKISDCCCRGTDIESNLGQYYKKILEYIFQNGYTPVMWGDMLIKYERITDLIPKTTIIIDWEYHKGLKEKNYDKFYASAKSFNNPDDSSFANTEKLKSKGYGVLCAPALRSMGDSSFIPGNMHLDNCVEAFYTAKSTMGIMITSWSVRRSPWQLTELVLNVISQLFTNENITYEEAIKAYAKKTFGTDDTALGESQLILADKVKTAMSAADFLSSGQDFMDAETGMFLSDTMANRLKSTDIRNNQEVKKAYTELWKTAEKIKEQLKHQNTPRMLLWAADTAVFYGKYVSELCDNYSNPVWKSEMAEKFDDFKNTVSILGNYYTDFSMPSEYQARIDIHKDYIAGL